MNDRETLAFWRSAIHRADEGAPDELVALLRSSVEIPERARVLLADLHERKQLKRKPGRPRRPVDQPRRDAWARAVGAVRKLHGESGMAIDAAIDLVAAHWCSFGLESEGPGRSRFVLRPVQTVHESDKVHRFSVALAGAVKRNAKRR